MMSFLKWFSTFLVLVALSGVAAGAEAISAGKVKVINSDRKDFVLTDAANKDWTIQFGKNVVINRGGKESKSDLNVGDSVNVCHDSGILTWTAHYILVQEGDTKNFALVRGTVKGYHEEKKEISFSDGSKDYTFPVNDARVSLNKEASKAGALKVGDAVLAIVETVGDKSTLKALLVDRK